MKLNVNLQDDNTSITVEEQNDTLYDVMSDVQTVTPPPMDSPVFTGVPIAPTAPLGTNTEQIATTSFVHGEIVMNNLSYGNIARLNISEVTS